MRPPCTPTPLGLCPKTPFRLRPALRQICSAHSLRSWRCTNIFARESTVQGMSEGHLSVAFLINSLCRKR